MHNLQSEVSAELQFYDRDGSSDLDRQSPAASCAEQNGEQLCEVTAIRKPVTGGSVAPVSPAISPAVIANVENNQESRQQLSKSGNQSGNGNTKPNCYECKYRRDAEFSSHSVCHHPRIGEVGQFVEVAFLMRGLRGPAMMALNVTGSRHGISHGWFTWPLDFDPVWLTTCDGFEKKV